MRSGRCDGGVEPLGFSLSWRGLLLRPEERAFSEPEFSLGGDVDLLSFERCDAWSAKRSSVRMLSITGDGVR